MSEPLWRRRRVPGEGSSFAGVCRITAEGGWAAWGGGVWSLAAASGPDLGVGFDDFTGSKMRVFSPSISRRRGTSGALVTQKVACGVLVVGWPLTVSSLRAETVKLAALRAAVIWLAESQNGIPKILSLLPRFWGASQFLGKG